MSIRTDKFEFCTKENEQIDAIIKVYEEKNSVIHGLVVDCKNKPVKDAVVKLLEKIKTPYGIKLIPLTHAFTDSCGQFIFGPLCPNKKYVLKVWYDNVSIRNICFDNSDCDEDCSCIQSGHNTNYPTCDCNHESHSHQHDFDCNHESHSHHHDCDYNHESHSHEHDFDCNHESHSHEHDFDCNHESHSHEHDFDCNHESHSHEHDFDCNHESHSHEHDCDCNHESHSHEHDCDCNHESHSHEHDCDCNHESQSHLEKFRKKFPDDL